MTRDSSRNQVYTAEDLAAERTVLTTPLPLERLRWYAAGLLRTPWWLQNFAAEPVAIAVNRSAQWSYYSSDHRRISLSAAALDLNTLCHELAHVAAADEGCVEAIHGPRFRALHVLVRTAMLGPACGADLRAVYGQFGLSVASASDLRGTAEGDVVESRSYTAERVLGRPTDGPVLSNLPGPIAL